MDIANGLRAAPLAFQLAALLATTSLSAQAEPSPTTTDAPAQAPTSEVPQMELDTPVDHVVAPPAVRPPQAAPAASLPPPVVQAPLPACELRASPSPCVQPEDAYRHDGFYLRIANETQYLGFLGSGPDGDASVKGLGSGGMLALGGTPLPGLVLGGTLSSDMLRGKFNGRPQGEEDKASIARAMLGAFVDWYPQADDGWHVGAAIGLAGITLTDSSIKDAVGAAFSAKLFGGYDWWIGPQWSLGVAALFAATPSTTLRDRDGDRNGYRFYTLSAGLAWSLTLH
jgi:hypothetical protein